MSQVEASIVGHSSWSDSRELVHSEPMLRDQIVVLGMHRSGTSAVTELIHTMGAYVGDADSLTKQSWQNARGFFERQDVRKICEALLQGAGADWWKVSGFHPDSVPHSVLEEQMRAIRRVVEQLASHGTWVIKEPRLCMLFPLFKRFLHRAIVVHAVRHPVEVAQSLRFRNGFPLQVGLALWEVYNVAIINNAAGVPTVVVNYDELVGAPSAVASRIATDLGRLGARGMSHEEAAKVVDASLRRERTPAQSSNDRLTEAQARLWKALSEGAELEIPREPSPDAIALLKEFEADETSRRSNEARRRVVVEQLKERDQQYEALKAELDDRDARSSSLEREVKLAKAEAEKLSVMLGKRQAEIDSLKARLEASYEQATALTSRLEASASEKESLEAALAIVGAERTEQASQLARREADLARMEDDRRREKAESIELAERARQSETMALETLGELRREHVERSTLVSELSQRTAEVGKLSLMLDRERWQSSFMAPELVRRGEEIVVLRRRLVQSEHARVHGIHELAQRDAEIIVLRERVGHEKEEQIALRAKLSDEFERNEQLRAGMEQEAAAVASLSGILEDERVRIAALSREVEERTNCVMALQQAAQSSVARDELTRAERRVSELTTELMKRDRDFSALQQKLESAGAENTRLRGDLDARSSEITRLVSESEGQVAEISLLRRDLSTRRLELKRLERVNKEQTNQHANLVAAHESKRSECNSLEARVTTLDSENRGLQRELKSHRDRVRQLSDDLKRRASQIHALECRVESLDENREHLRERRAYLEAKSKRLEAKIVKLDRRITFLKSTISWRITAPLRAVARLLAWLFVSAASRSGRRALPASTAKHEVGAVPDEMRLSATGGGRVTQQARSAQAAVPSKETEPLAAAHDSALPCEEAASGTGCGTPVEVSTVPLTRAFDPAESATTELEHTQRSAAKPATLPGASRGTVRSGTHEPSVSPETGIAQSAKLAAQHEESAAPDSGTLSGAHTDIKSSCVDIVAEPCALPLDGPAPAWAKTLEGRNGRPPRTRRAAMWICVRGAEAATEAQQWSDALERWQFILDEFPDVPSIAGKARLNVSVARRMAEPKKYLDAIEEYQRARLGRFEILATNAPRIAVYTAVCGGYDSIKLPEYLDPRIDYFLFSEYPVPETGIFRVLPIPFEDHDRTRLARYVKTHPHQLLSDYDIAIWIDANIMIIEDISPMIEGFLASGRAVAAIPHPQRQSIYEEGEACVERSKDKADVIAEQLARYRAVSFDCEDLIESNFMMLDLRDERVHEFLDTWSAELHNYSRRDQLSLNFALRQAGLDWHPLTSRPNSIRNHSRFGFAPHDSGKGAPSALLSIVSSLKPLPLAPRERRPSPQKPARKKAAGGCSRVRLLRQRLFELGQAERAASELREIATKRADREDGRLAAWQLAWWHANQGGSENAAECLKYLRMLNARSHAHEFRSQAAILASECHALLGDMSSAKSVLTEALANGETPDLHFARGILELSPIGRISAINRALELSGVTAIRVGDYEANDPFSRLLVGGDASLDQVTDRTGISQQPSVSVIMPVYNSERTIATALRSVLAQTWRNIEVLVIDDCSDDRTVTVVREFAANDTRVKLLQLDANSGPYVARNTALQRATGEFVTCHDADDWSHPMKLEVQVHHLVAHPTAVANTSQWVRLTDELKAYRRGNPGYFVQLNVSSLLFRRLPVTQALGYWDSVRFGADSEFYVRLRKAFGEQAVVQLTEVLSFARCSEDSLTGHAKFGYHGFPMGARRDYRESYMSYLSSTETLRYHFPMKKRPFGIPLSMVPQRATNSDTVFTAIVATDLRLRESANWVRALLEREQDSETGARVGLVQLYDYEQNPRVPLDSGVRRLVDEGRAVLLSYGESAKCTLLIAKGLSALADRPVYVPTIDASEVVAIVDGLPHSEHASFSTMASALGSYAEHLRVLCDRAAHWVPASSRIRDLLERDPTAPWHELQVTPFNWPHCASLGEVVAQVGQSPWARPTASPMETEGQLRMPAESEARQVSIQSLDSSALVRWPPRPVGGVLVVVPSSDLHSAQETARALATTAGMPAKIVALHDCDDWGFARAVNETVARFRARYIAFLPPGATPTKGWLRRAYELLDASDKGFLRFSEGDWRNPNSGWGMVKTSWLRGIYGELVFCPLYHGAAAASELLAIALGKDEHTAGSNCFVQLSALAPNVEEHEALDVGLLDQRHRSGFGGCLEAS